MKPVVPRFAGRARTALNLLMRFAVRISVFLAAIWAVFAIWFYQPMPFWLRSGMAFLCAIWFLWLRLSNSPNYGARRRWLAFAGTLAIVAGGWLLFEPTSDGEWSRLHATMVQTDFASDTVHLRDIRNTTLLPDGGYEVRHYDKSIDLTQVKSVWFGVQQFVSWRGGSHTFVSFEFDDGTFLAISVEARRGEGEQFNPLRGMFKQCGLIYVVGDELDVIGSRAAESKYPIYLYPMRSTRKQAREMFEIMLRRADSLRTAPEFYHTTVNNCTTNIVNSLNVIAPIRISPFNWRVMFPGYSGGVAYEQGLIDSDAPFSEVQKMARINERAKDATSDNFSQQIRSGFEAAK